MEAGDKLPSVRELAGQLAINPNTIQRAYRELEMEGWIATAAGKGCFVSGSPWETDPLADFDALVNTLLGRGISREELINRLEKGGNEDAGSKKSNENL